MSIQSINPSSSDLGVDTQDNFPDIDIDKINISDTLTSTKTKRIRRINS